MPKKTPTGRGETFKGFYYSSHMLRDKVLSFFEMQYKTRYSHWFFCYAHSYNASYNIVPILI